MEPIGLLPRKQNLGGGAGEHGQGGSHRNGIAQAAKIAFRGGDADADLALATVQLGGFAGVITQGDEDGLGGRDERIATRGGGELLHSRAENETALHIPGDKPVIFQGDGEPVGGGAGESGSCDELCERLGARF